MDTPMAVAVSAASDDTAAVETHALDISELKGALGAFLTGVTVATTLDPRTGEPRGFTANSFTSVSLSPPLVLVCIGDQSRSYDVFVTADGFAVNVLARDQKSVAGAFASRDVSDRFAAATWKTGPAGHPVLEGAASWLDCQRHEIVRAGDHAILIGRVIGFGASDREPLGYLRGQFVG